jgi:uncharacterized membrane protein
MIETFLGEAILVISMISGVAVGDGQMVLALIIIFFFIIILALAGHFYRAGWPGSVQGGDIR